MKDEVEKLLMRKDNAILYTDTVGGKQTLRDYLWAVSSEEIENIIQLFQKAQVESVRAELEMMQQISFEHDEEPGDAPSMTLDEYIADRLARLRGSDE